MSNIEVNATITAVQVEHGDETHSYEIEICECPPGQPRRIIATMTAKQFAEMLAGLTSDCRLRIVDRSAP